LAELQNNGHDSDAFDKIMQNVDLQTKCQNYEDERKKIETIIVKYKPSDLDFKNISLSDKIQKVFFK